MVVTMMRATPGPQPLASAPSEPGSNSYSDYENTGCVLSGRANNGVPCDPLNIHRRVRVYGLFERKKETKGCD